MIDTHCHLTYPGLIERVDQVVADALAAGVTQLISVSTSPDDARLGAELSQKYPSVFSTVGVHPCHADQCPDKSRLLDAMTQIAGGPKVVAVGEIGLDQHHPQPPLDIQQKVLDWQLDWVSQQPKAWPIIIHNRQTTDRVLATLKASGIAGARFVFHCFTGTPGELQAILDFGAQVSFTGVVTFKNSTTLLADSAIVPLDRIMIETDSPYLTPAPHRRIKTNEPKFVPLVAQALASVRPDVSRDDFQAIVTANSRRFFALPPA